MKTIQERVLRGEYVMTLHAEEEMTEDGYTIFDVENGIVTGGIVERQKDMATDDWKYCIRGKAVSSGEIEIIVRLGPTNKVVIITVYAP